MYGVIAIRLIVGSSYFPSREKPWVARLGGLCAQYGLQREFVRGVYDYTYATKQNGKNTYLYFNLPPGLYEVYQPTSWKHERRYFVCVTEDGEVQEISKDEAVECLKNTTSE